MRWLGGVRSEGAIAREVGFFTKAEERDELSFWALELARPKTFLGQGCDMRLTAFALALMASLAGCVGQQGSGGITVPASKAVRACAEIRGPG